MFTQDKIREQDEHLLDQFRGVQQDINCAREQEAAALEAADEENAMLGVGAFERGGRARFSCRAALTRRTPATPKPPPLTANSLHTGSSAAAAGNVNASAASSSAAAAAHSTGSSGQQQAQHEDTDDDEAAVPPPAALFEARRRSLH